MVSVSGMFLCFVRHLISVILAGAYSTYETAHAQCIRWSFGNVHFNNTFFVYAKLGFNPIKGGFFSRFFFVEIILCVIILAL